MVARIGHELVGATSPAAHRFGVSIRLGRDTLLAFRVARTGRASGAADKGGEELFAALQYLFEYTPGMPYFIDGPFLFGRVAEWTIAPVLKTGAPQGAVGSNPTPSAYAKALRRTRPPSYARPLRRAGPVDLYVDSLHTSK